MTDAEVRIARTAYQIVRMLREIGDDGVAGKVFRKVAAMYSGSADHGIVIDGPGLTRVVEEPEPTVATAEPKTEPAQPEEKGDGQKD